MTTESYREAYSLFWKLYRKVNNELRAKKTEGGCTEEEYYDLNLRVIDYTCRSFRKGSFRRYMEKDLSYIFLSSNKETIDHLTKHLQDDADRFCDEKKIPKLKVNVKTPAQKGFSAPATLKKDKEIEFNLGSSFRSRNSLEDGLDHELRHHYLYSKFKPAKYFGNFLNFMLPPVIMAAGYATHNGLLYDAGAAYWSIGWGSEIYADIPRKKYVMLELGFASLPWIFKLLTKA